MFRLFKKRQQYSAASVFWQNTGKWIEGRLRILANRLNKRFSGCSPSLIKLGLITFCVIYASLLFYVLLRGPWGNARVETISIPKHVAPPEDNAARDVAPLLSPEAYRRLIHFRQYMDSLQKTPEGRAEYERVARAHPGIRDSIEYIISIFEEHDKNIMHGKEK